ncbi:uncharacterized protein G2W53_006844 [Senna tora]|uniref:Uncharacterized protein n=1 Tax=Senna tora TaxID=362788 RepID=A0A834X5W7_9FABA|nr:uncharacterized protein G2W53_006844 [Senna tora]
MGENKESPAVECVEYPKAKTNKEKKKYATWLQLRALKRMDG